MGNTNIKKGILRRLCQTGMLVIFLCFFFMTSASAETISTASLKKGYTSAELDQMLAPIALYPDALLLQVLMASTYPTEVVEASRWLDANAELSGDAAVEAAEPLEWNVSVKSLLAFSDVLFTMSSNMDWTVKLGNAFNTQREDVMERVQYLRRQARATGNLKSDERMNVVRSGNDIAIEPVSQEVIYVPYYNPTIVYGSWWWPGYAPYYWRPWRGYAYYPGYYSSSFMWGRGIWFSYTRFHGSVNWRRRHVHWGPSPKHPVLGHVRPGNKLHPDSNHVRPGNRSGQSGYNPAWSGMRLGLAGAATYRSAHNRPAHAGQPIRNMANNRPSVLRPDTNVVRSRPLRVSQPAMRSTVGEHQAGSSSRAPSRPAVSQQSTVSGPAGPRSSGGMSYQGSRHRGSSRR